VKNSRLEKRNHDGNIDVDIRNLGYEDEREINSGSANRASSKVLVPKGS
jgi:hypothetical protein